MKAVRLGAWHLPLALALVACGKVLQSDSGMVLGTGGDPQAEPTGAAGEGGASSAAHVSCAFPQHAAAAFAGPSDALDYNLSSEYSLPLMPADWNRFIGAYDVNGDGVSDIIYANPRYNETRLQLLLSDPSSHQLKLAPASCPDLEALPVGTLFLRDLDADGVPDFVLYTDQTLHVYLNHAAGFESVLTFDWPKPNNYASVINIAEADLNGDGRQDLAITFDRAIDETSSWETGAVSFLQRNDGQLVIGQTVRTPVSDMIPDSGVFSGYLATGRFFAAPSFVTILGRFGPTSLKPSLGKLFDASERDLVAAATDSVLRLATIPGSGYDRVATVGRSSFTWWELGWGSPLAVLTEPLVFEGGQSHELGGGHEYPRDHFFDIDGDGDLDFVELGADAFAIHVNLGSDQFAPPLQFPASLSRDAERPFLRVGSVMAVLTATREDAVPTIQTLDAQ
jgi:hypothetical protein